MALNSLSCADVSLSNYSLTRAGGGHFLSHDVIKMMWCDTCDFFWDSTCNCQSCLLLFS